VTRATEVKPGDDILIGTTRMRLLQVDALKTTR
jgi:hypothetical protein